MKNVAIVNYGMGNLDSVLRVVEELGEKVFLADKDTSLENCSHIILPGVGSFYQGMNNLNSMGLTEALKIQVLQNNIPILGICLGMQLFATKGFEGGETEGLNFIPGEVVLFSANNKDEKIPHIGWNEVNLIKDSNIFNGIENGKDFYFVHSYHLKCYDENNIIANTPYCGFFNSIIGKDNVWGVQFHPEKSQKPGFRLIKNFLDL